MNPKIIVVLLSAALCCSSAFGAQIHVPSDQPTIQAGINAATNGDTVLVAPGTYNEGIHFTNKNIAVISEAGPEVTIIDSHRSNYVAIIVGAGAGRTARLQGFTLRNGAGGLLLAGGASVTIMGNIIASNVLCGGAGIDVEFCSPLIISNKIYGNSQPVGCSGAQGGAIYVGGAAAAEIVHNTIVSNTASGNGGGISLFAAGTPIIRENMIGWNTGDPGGGISILNYGDATIINNVIVSNVAFTGGGIYASVPSPRRGPYVINNTIAFNRGTVGSGIYSDGFDAATLYANNVLVAFSNQTAFYVGNFDASVPIIRYNDLFSPSGASYGGIGSNPVGANGNIATDPLFLNPPLKDYRLRTNSPAIEAGLNSDAPTNDMNYVSRPYDADGNGTNRVDMGAYEWIPIRASLTASNLLNRQPAIAWTSSGGGRYRIQYSDGDTLGGLNGIFTDIVRTPAAETDPGPDGAPSIMTFTDPNVFSVTNHARYYRIKTLSQP